MQGIIICSLFIGFWFGVRGLMAAIGFSNDINELLCVLIASIWIICGFMMAGINAILGAVRSNNALSTQSSGWKADNPQPAPNIEPPPSPRL